MDSQQRRKATSKLLEIAKDPEIASIAHKLFCESQPDTLPKNETSESKMHPIASYFLRGLGIVGLLLGGAGIMADLSFMTFGLCIGFGLVLLAIDPWLEPSLRPYLLIKIIGSSFFASILVAFCVLVVFPRDPLTIKCAGLQR